MSNDKVRLMIEVSEDTINECKVLFGQGYANDAEYAISQGTPYNPSGDCISREALKEAISKVVAEERKEDPMWANGLRYALTIINEAQTVEHSLLPLASEADNAYMRGYEVGKAEGIMKASARPKDDCENCDYRKFSETCIDAFVEVMNEFGITSVEELIQKLKGGAK